MDYGKKYLEPISLKRATKTQLNVLPSYFNSNYFKGAFDKAMKVAFIGLGQMGGRVAREAAILGFPAFIVNTALGDMAEHKDVIPDENRIFTPLRDKYGEAVTNIQGTGKDAGEGYRIAEANEQMYDELLERDEIKHADFVFVCASLGGGTGNGALPFIVSKLIDQKESQFGDRMGYVSSLKKIGLICSLPSKDERGLAYRENAINGLDYIVNNLILDKQIGTVYLIDNEHIKHTEFTKKYLNEIDNKIDSRTLANAVAITSLLELLSIFLLEGRGDQIDTNELHNILGTAGFLNIKHVLNDEKVIKDYNSEIGQDYDGKEVALDFAKKIIDSENILADIDTNYIDNALFQIIQPEANYPTRLTEEIKDAMSSLIGQIHPGTFSMQSQRGVSAILAYNTTIPPVRYKELIEEREKEIQQLEEKEREKQALLQSTLAAPRKANPFAKGRQEYDPSKPASHKGNPFAKPANDSSNSKPTHRINPFSK
ncbi:cell division protein FtsZ [Lysinibacillus capsici]|uniref:Cell division protein FtsZ n=1 Tax=Lysinibacillus capsici TaxID=2115968 RepID=A0A2X1BNX2_9BACI|nr:hypothetical protein [Lysinibacillus capsici]SPU37548.1 cell division protein FtsZ [Lysinibacillus capsici]